MLVTLKPYGREEYLVRASAVPVYSFALFGGMERAEIACELDAEQYATARGGTLRIHGETGVVWQGIVTRRPSKGEPLIALGWGWCATWNRRAAFFCDTSTSAWVERTLVSREDRIHYMSDATRLRFDVESGQSLSGGNNGCWRRIPLTAASRVTFSWARESGKLALGLYKGTGPAATASNSGGLEVTGGWGSSVWTASADSGTNSGTASVDISGSHDSLLFYVASNNPVGFGADVAVTFSDVKVYGENDTTATDANTIINDVLTDEIPAAYLPAGSQYRAWIGSPAGSIEPLVFDSCSAEDKFAEVVKYAAYDFGWYPELVRNSRLPVPHYTARSTTPDYVLHLADAEAHDLDEASLDEMISAVRVHWADKKGVDQHTDVASTNMDDPLVAAGITRYADLDVQTTSSSTATTYGQSYLAENARDQVKGTVTVRELLTAAGTDAYLPTIRPGRMVRVLGLPTGQIDAIIRRVTLSGDARAALEIDNEPYSLDIALAKLAKRER